MSSTVKVPEMEDYRAAIAYYWKAIDAIYNDGEEGRRLVIEHFGLWHPPYQRRDDDRDVPSNPEDAKSAHSVGER